mmetsp:Transcript_18771/g.28120  ORF Transcript_18771/g.28120 Transcript_18771/m.28120 type:complete len:559 (+) Transcript_18771:81-1757(+)
MFFFSRLLWHDKLSEDPDGKTSENTHGPSSLEDKLFQLITLHRHTPKEWEPYTPPALRGILLYGPPGCGKTYAVKRMCKKNSIPLLTIETVSAFGKNVGFAERTLREKFEEAQRITEGSSDGNDDTCVIFIDEIDAMCPARDMYSNDSTIRVVAQLLTLMDGLKAKGNNQIVVIGATNRPNAIEPALRRPGRFDQELSVPVPTLNLRCSILEEYFSKMQLDEKKIPILAKRIAEKTVGFVGADLAFLCQQAAINRMKKSNSRTDSESVNEAGINFSDFNAVLKTSMSSSLRRTRTRGGQMIRYPNVSWKDIGGIHEIKSRLKTAVEWPLLYSDRMKRLGLSPTRGILLYGPPGCSKTTLARAMASSCKAAFVTGEAATIYSPFLGESERLLRQLFKLARANQPCVLFLDELDAIVSKRDTASSGGSQVENRLLTTLLTEMDGVSSAGNVVVVAATNRKDKIDDALLRPGRFDYHMHVGKPDELARKAILKIHTRIIPLSSNLDVTQFAKDMAGFSGAEIENTCREAAFFALRRGSEMVCAKDFQSAILEANVSDRKAR